MKLEKSEIARMVDGTWDMEITLTCKTFSEAYYYRKLINNAIKERPYPWVKA